MQQYGKGFSSADESVLVQSGGKVSELLFLFMMRRAYRSCHVLTGNAIELVEAISNISQSSWFSSLMVAEFENVLASATCVVSWQSSFVLRRITEFVPTGSLVLDDELASLLDFPTCKFSTCDNLSISRPSVLLFIITIEFSIFSNFGKLIIFFSSGKSGLDTEAMDGTEGPAFGDEHNTCIFLLSPECWMFKENPSFVGVGVYVTAFILDSSVSTVIFCWLPGRRDVSTK